MALADFPTYLERIKNPPFRSSSVKQSLTTIAGRCKSLWLAGGNEQGATPTTHAQCDKTTVGAVIFAGGGTTLRLAAMEVAWATGGTLALADRLVASGGLDGTSASVQSLAAVALPRNTSGEGVRAAIEIYTVIGSTTREATVLYTNTANVSGRTGAVTMGALGSKEANAFCPIRLQAGDTGLLSVQSVQLAGTTGTAGNFGVTLYRPKWFGMVPGMPLAQAYLNPFIGGGRPPPAIDANACLFFQAYTNTTITDDLTIELSIIDE